MERIRILTLAALLLVAHFALAADDDLSGIGQLIMTGRAQEARELIVKTREAYAHQPKAVADAALILLLGLTDIALRDTSSARIELAQAEAAFVAHRDFFGAWMAQWSLAELEANAGRYDEAIVAHDRALAMLREAESPQEQISPETLKVLGPVFGASIQMLGPLMDHPQLMKPFVLGLTAVMARDRYARMLLESGRQLDKVESLLREAAAASSKLFGLFDFQIQEHLGDLRRMQWRLDDARVEYLKAMESLNTTPLTAMHPGGSAVELKILVKLGTLEMLGGRVDEALSWNDRALTKVRAGRDRRREAWLLEARSELLHKAGRYEAAIAFLEDALKIATETADVHRQASVHSTFGTLHMYQGTYGSAAAHLEAAIAMYKTLGEPLLESTAWMTLASVRLLLDSPDSALSAARTAADRAEKSGFAFAMDAARLLKNGIEAFACYGDAGVLARGLTEWASSPEMATVSWPKEIETLIQQMVRGGTNTPLTADPARLTTTSMPGLQWAPLLLRGRVHYEKGDLKSAREVWLEALKHNPGRDLRAGLQGVIGTTYWNEGNRAEGIRYFKEAAKSLDRTAADVKVEEMLASYLGSGRRVYYEFLVDMLVLEGRPAEAFEHAERARARAFLQMVGNHRFNAERGADPRLVAEAEILRTHIVEQEYAAQQASGPEASRIEAELDGARQRYQELIQRVKASNPEYASLTMVEPLDLAEVRKEIPPDATLVSYFTTPHSVHAWIITGDATHYRALPIDRTELRRIVCWADQLVPRQDPRGVRLPATCRERATAEEAYEKLIAPFAETIHTRKVVLVPHGLLHYVPFVALRNAATGHHLIDDFVLTLAPSASALRFLHTKETPVDGGALILGDPDSPLPGLSRLPGAAQEATAIAQMTSMTAHVGADAREALLYSLGGKTDLVHLAAHGLYDPKNPIFSRIALAGGGDHDGSLTVNEILSSLDLTGVNLVVLSACRTAVGARSGGDEVVGLTRALLYAGTPAVLSTLWNINDDAAAGLMKEFYRRLTSGESAPEALRGAQIAIKSNPRFAHPRYWAAFTLTGDPQGRWKRPTP